MLLRPFGIFLALACQLGAAQTQPPTAAKPPAQLTAAQDHQRLLDLLHISALRPGVSSSPTAPNPANYDEAKANPYPSLPNPLALNDGSPVTTPQMWWTERRPQLIEFFDREIYGRVPSETPAVDWRVVSITRSRIGGIATLTKHLIGRVDNASYPLIQVNIEASLSTPADAPGPVPVMLELTFDNYPLPANRPPPPPPKPEPGPNWKQQVLAKGWGYALLYPTTVQADNGAGLTQGIIGLCNHGQPRGLDQWGAIRAWAWGASRLLDYLQTDTSVDARHVGIDGHSRFGKTALVAMAYDSRFAVAYVNSSGAGGAAPARRHYGEQIENVAAAGEYHWMAGNYLKYAGPLTPGDLPVDADELIALCAPRPVFLGGGTTAGGDGWADVRGSFLAEVAAGPVYRLLGARGLETTSFPPVGVALIRGDLGFRQHSGGHTPAPDWPTFITFASRFLVPAAATAQGD